MNFNMILRLNNDMPVTLILGYGAAKELVAKWVLRPTPRSKSGVCEVIVREACLDSLRYSSSVR